MKQWILSAALVGGLILSGFSANNALAINSNDAVKETFTGGRVVDSRGNCVRTKWEKPNDICAPEPPPRAAAPTPPPPPPPPPPAPTRQLHKGDLTIYFDFDSAKLTAESTAKLDRLSALLQQDVTVEAARVVGYTDSIGSDSYNQILSQRRADAVNAYIRERGYLGNTSAEVRAFGPQNPVTDCSASKARKALIACKAPDRRVEIEIKYLQ